ncbi:MAG TPA: ABC transporter permease [Candidatus Limnocylindrales bacterium]|nr:ABC transporter permease [Candidatus Limnocylindrales bacterium]
MAAIDRRAAIHGGGRAGRRSDGLEEELAGLDRLELPLKPVEGRLAALWATTWPKLAAVVTVVAAWQLVVASGWRPEYVLPSPLAVAERLARDLSGNDLQAAIAITLRRAGLGFGLALAIGVGIGLAIVASRRLRAAAASLVTGLQTMPSIAWFPFAILLFGLSETAILFVVVLGAAPSIANGLIAGVDQIPRLILRAGRILGARGWAWYRHVILPAALPSFVSGLKQGWAFSWRSLMAGELLVIIAAQPSIGVRLQFARELADAPGLLAAMLVILAIGIAVDGLLFGTLERTVRQRWGLAEPRR